jgi:hypothetical protein
MDRRNDCASGCAPHGKNESLPAHALVMEVRFRESAVAELRGFVRNYEEAFVRLYSDTGILDEATIVENYKRSALKIFTDVFTSIKGRLAHGKVFGRKKNERRNGQWREVNFHVGDRLVIVYYSDESSAKIRWIESISIDRKPIIF